MSTALRPPLPLLTTLRFFAATEVVVNHSLTLRMENFLTTGLGSAGYQSVTFFFVLSGFILTYVYSGAAERDKINVPTWEFWRARVARIYPAYCLGLFLALPILLYAAFVSKIMAVEWLLLAFLLVPFLLQAWWPVAANLWNAPAWSLSVEALFYALFPAMVRIGGKVSRNKFLVLAYCAVIAVTVFRYTVLDPYSVPETTPWNLERFFPPLHLPQFIFGMALGRLYLFGHPLSPRVHLAFFCLGVIGLLAVLGIRAWFPWWAQTDAVLAVLFGLVIFGGARSGDALKILSAPVFILLGEVSYGMYILHIPLQFWWTWLTQKILGQTLPVVPDFLGYFLFVVGASILSYLYVEKPMRRRILGHREHRVA